MARKKEEASQRSTPEVLELFLSRVDHLLNTRLLQDRRLQTSLTINFDRFQGLSFSSPQPDENDLQAFLLMFRRFVSDAEPVFLGKIRNMLERSLTSDYLLQEMREERRIWKEYLLGKKFPLFFNGKLLLPEQVADLWVNGFYFHDDFRKQRWLRSLQPLEHALTRTLFLDYLITVTRHVLFTSQVVAAAFKEGALHFEA